MQRNLLISVLVLLTFSGFSINRRMMEDKTLVGFQASYMLPIGAYANDVNGAVGGGIRGKYFGTNTFAFGFDFGFFAPQMKQERIDFVADSILRPALRQEQQLGRIDDSVQILDVTGNSQYIPFNVSFEFYFPKTAFNNFRPYAGIGLGLNMINRRYKATYNAPKTKESGIPVFEDRIQPSSNRGYMSINPTVGFLWTLNELWNINMDMRYNQFLGGQKGGALSFHFGVVLDLSFKYVR
ncbi:MAG: hypothetical protein FWE63_05510 [Bacteroidales bacterium]|nr:hypothetical protein [Bacteroidales bacterium]